MSQSPNVESVAPTLRAKDLRAMKLGVLPRTLWSNEQDPALLIINTMGECVGPPEHGFLGSPFSPTLEPLQTP